MNNKQLLIKAAKAAGYELYGYDERIVNDSPHGTTQWNPIESDADAFRLMVDCKLEVAPECYLNGAVEVYQEHANRIVEQYADHNNDKHAATRMAIVRAAAQSQEQPQ